jgi:xylulokinase
MICSIDLGSTSFKAAIYDRDLRCLGEGAASLVYAPVHGHEVELPVDAAETALRDAVKNALQNAACSAQDLKAVALSSQAQTFTVVGLEGRARSPFISWLDTRGEGDTRVRDALPGFENHCSLHDCVSMLMVSKVGFLQEQGALVGDNDRLMLLPTWFAHRFTGRACVDANLAASTGLYSLEYSDWWTAALTTAGVALRNLPERIALGEVAARTTSAAADFGLPANIPVVLAGNDQTAAAYAVPMAADDTLLITLGTAQVGYRVLDDMPGPVPGVIRGPYPGAKAYQMVADDYGGVTVNWARSILEGCASESDFDVATSQRSATYGDLAFVLDGPAGRGRWTGVTSQTTDADKARAVLEGLVDRLSDMIDRLGGPDAFSSISVAGGGSHSKPWVAGLEQRLGKTLHPTSSASPVLGGARMALRHCV